MTRSLISALACLLAASSCATVAGSADLYRESLRFEAPPLPTSGWKQLATPDFELLTDLPDAEAERAGQLITQSLEGLRAMFGKAIVVERRPLRIIALNDELEFERTFGRGVGGLAGTQEGVAVLFLKGAPNRWFQRGSTQLAAKDSVLQHELAHAILRQYIQLQPKWFAEGMAQYLETFRWIDSQTVLIGEVNVEALRRYAAVRSLTVKDLFEQRDARGRELAGLYGLSWALVHYAINREPQRFTALMAALIEGDELAFEHTFGPDTERLDVAIHQYLKTGQYQVIRLQVPRREPVAVHLVPTARPASLNAVSPHDLE